MSEANIIGQIATRDQERMRGYQESLDFYNGKQWPGRERYGEKRLTFNYSKVFIDKITSYLMSGINFTVEAMEDTIEARARAEEAEKSLSRVYEANNLMQLDIETETDCAILGDGCYKVTWDEGEGRVRVTAPDIQGIYAWWMGDDMARVWRVASKYQLSEEEVEILYGDNKFEIRNSKYETNSNNQILNPIPSTQSRSPNSGMKTVLEVWTDTEFELYLDGVQIDKKPNPYGFIPFVIFPNLRDPKKFWGASDLTPIIEPQRELNREMSQLSRILEISGNPICILENVEESNDIAVQPGAVWNLPESSKAYILDLLQGGGLQLHINYMELLHRSLHDIAETPREAFGGMTGSMSGVAMQIALDPLSQKIRRKRIFRTPAYNRRNWMILDLISRFGHKKKIIEISRNDYRIKVVWGQVLPQDQEKLVANEQILVQNGIHSRRRAMDEVGVKDPEAEFKHWKEEQTEILQINTNTTNIK